MGIKGIIDEEEFETSMSEVEARRLVKYLVDHGMSKEEAYETLVYTMGATLEQIEELGID